MYVQFAELPVVDQDRAKRFYAEKLGCEVVADARQPNRVVAEFRDSEGNRLLLGSP